MRPGRIIYLFVCVSLILTSCENKLDREDYIKWVHDYRNGLHVKKTFSSFVFDLQYQPDEYISLVKNEPLGADVSDSLAIEYFTLNVSLIDPSMDLMSYDASSGAEQQRRKYYFSYLFQEDIYLDEGGERIPCVLFHLEPQGLQRNKTFVLGFAGHVMRTSDIETRFVIDSPYFSSLPIKISISKKDIPSLKI